MLFAALAALFVLVAQVGTQGPPPGRGAGAPADGLPAAAREVLVKFNGPLGGNEQQSCGSNGIDSFFAKPSRRTRPST